MSIQDWGAIGEIVGAIGVVISLLYLASQIRLNAKATEDATMRELFTAAGTLASTMAEGPHRKIIMSGLVDYQNLTGEEKFAFDSLMGALINIVESSFASTTAELLTNEAVDNWSNYLQRRFFAYEGFAHWWEESKPQYVSGVREWIDMEISKADTQTDFWKIK